MIALLQDKSLHLTVWPLKLTLAEKVTFATLGTILITILVRVTSNPELWTDFWIHGSVLLIFTVFVFFADRNYSRSSWITGRPLGALLVMFTLYFTLASLPFKALPWRADALLFRLDQALFSGTSPALWLEGRLSVVQVEVLSLAYILFIPFVYLSVVVGIWGRDPRERERLFTALVLLYALSFVGYLFAPARGPVVFLAPNLSALPGGSLHGYVVKAVQASGGPHGALPSLHLGVSVLVCLFETRYNRLRGLIYWPFTLGIVLATVALRYHWVIDLLVGVALAIIALGISHHFPKSIPSSSEMEV